MARVECFTADCNEVCRSNSTCLVARMSIGSSWYTRSTVLAVVEVGPLPTWRHEVWSDVFRKVGPLLENKIGNSRKISHACFVARVNYALDFAGNSLMKSRKSCNLLCFFSEDWFTFPLSFLTVCNIRAVVALSDNVVHMIKRANLAHTHVKKSWYAISEVMKIEVHLHTSLSCSDW